jgi:hypothetical protein
MQKNVKTDLIQATIPRFASKSLLKEVVLTLGAALLTGFTGSALMIMLVVGWGSM